MSVLSNFMITDGDVAQKGVISAPDRLRGTTAENKAVFDRLVREAVKEKYNAMLAELEAELTSILKRMDEISDELSAKADKAEAAETLAEKADKTEVAEALAIKADKGKMFTVTLPATGWRSGTQAVQNEAFRAKGYAYIYAPKSESFLAYLEAQVFADDVTTDGYMVFHVITPPDDTITINIFRQEANENE